MLNFDAHWADYARFMPALQDYYLRFLNRPAPQMPLPAGLLPSDLDFMNPASCLFSTPDVLLSAGVVMSSGNVAGLSRPLPASIAQRDFSYSHLLADSGGFQVASRGMPITDTLRVNQLRWSEEWFDATLPVDVPSWAVHKPGNPYHEKFQQALGDSLASLDVMRQYHRPANPKRVVPSLLRRLVPFQGHTKQEARAWVQAIIGGGYLRDFDGIAWGGLMRFDLVHVGETLLELDQHGMLDRIQHVHFLGTASPGFGVMLTSLKRALDARLGRSVRVTFDASTAFQYGYKYNRLFTGMHWAPGHPVMQFVQLSAQRRNRPDAIAPLSGSELGRFGIRMDDLRRDPNNFSAWDEPGQIMACNHSVEMSIRAVILANQLADSEPNCGVLPVSVITARKALEGMFGHASKDKAVADLTIRGTGLRYFKKGAALEDEQEAETV